MIAWMGFGNVDNMGRVFFESLGDERTKVSVAIDYEPEGAVEKVGDALGAVRRRVEGDLGRFKQFVESRHTQTGGWRGEIHEGQAGARGSTGLGATGTGGPTNPHGA